MGPRTEEFWSYLTGLAPVGEPFCLDRAHLREDLGFKSRQRGGDGNISAKIRNLIEAGCVRRLGWNLYVVTQRLEDA